MKPIHYGRQNISDDDIQSVVDVLRSDFLTQGPAVPRFEQALASYCGARFAVAVSNATAALHMACAAMDLGPGKRLWTSANTFAASSNCGLYLGAVVDFVDIDPGTYNLSVRALEQKLLAADRVGALPHVVIPVHHSGQSCDMDKIRELGKHYGFKILEDASHAVGGSYRGNKVGSCKFSDLAVFSFHPVKIVTTGEGGMLLTNDEALYKRLILLRNHGITKDVATFDRASHGPWYYQQIDLGWNYRMTDIQAALGWSQLHRINEFVRRRNEIAQFYRKELSDLPLRSQKESKESYSSYHLYPVRLQLDRIGKTQTQVFEELHALGIITNLHYIPVYLHPYYAARGFKPGLCPEAESYYSDSMTLPLYPDLSEDDLTRIVRALREVLLGDT